jgi:hypothetical protein
MGGLKKRECFGAAFLKSGKESSKFSIAIFSLTIYMRFFDILGAQNKNPFYNRLVLKEVINF